MRLPRKQCRISVQVFAVGARLTIELPSFGPRSRAQLLFNRRQKLGDARQREELLACLRVVAEDAQHRRCCRTRVDFLRAAHHHTHVPAVDQQKPCVGEVSTYLHTLDDHRHAAWLDGCLHRFCDLSGQTFLN